MKDSYKFLAGFIASIVLIAMDVLLLLEDAIGITMFFIMLVVAILISILPTALFKGTSVEFGNTSVHITAPFVDQTIPYSSITSISSSNHLDYGMRTFGYGGLRYGSGDFTSGSLGTYIRAADSSIPLVIVIKSGKKTIAFNLKSLDDTEEALLELESRVPHAKTDGLPPTTSEQDRSFKRMRNAVVAFSVVVMLVVLAIVAWTMTIGNISAIMEEECISIDATMMHEHVYYDDIVQIELRDDVDYGDRIGGLGNGKVLTGNYRNDEFGKYRLAVWRNVDECVVIHTVDKVIVFNLKDAENTYTFYKDLLDRVGAPSMVSSQKPAIYHTLSIIQH